MSKETRHATATIPAPSTEEAETAVTSTTIPEYDVQALAATSTGSIQAPRRRSMPLPYDGAVPVRRRASADGAPLRAAFLLSHVDDRMTIAQLAETAQIPLSDAIECFVLLSDLGVVELRMKTLGPVTARPPQPPDQPATKPEGRPPGPKSGLHPKP